MNTNSERIAQLLKGVIDEIKDAADKQDLHKVAELTGIATQLKVLQEQISAADLALDQLEKRIAREKSSAKILRKVVITVTAGMINQNLLTFTGPLRRHEVSVKQEFQIEAMPSHRRFRTRILRGGNRLRERGEIGRFYRDAAVKPGDCVILEEISPGEWTLQKAPAGTREPSIYDPIDEMKETLALAG